MKYKFQVGDVVKTLDLSKPVQTRDGALVRVLCTDASGPYCVVGLATDPSQPISGKLWRWDITGRSMRETEDGGDNLVNVPEKPESRTFELVMHRSNRNGQIAVGKHEPGWQPHENEVLARKLVTITEGEGVSPDGGVRAKT